MKKDSRKYTPEYKLKLVMESLKSTKSVAKVAEENDISPGVLCQWRKEFVKKAPSIFYYKKVSRKSIQTDKPLVTDAYMVKIRELREMHNMSQEQVAKYLGTSQTMYARYENGLSKMPIRHLMMLVKLYGVTSDYILGIRDDGIQDEVAYDDGIEENEDDYGEDAD